MRFKMAVPTQESKEKKYKANTEERFLDVNEVARRLAISPTNKAGLYRAIDKGYIKASRVTKWVVREGWLNNFIIEHEGEDISYMFK